MARTQLFAAVLAACVLTSWTTALLVGRGDQVAPPTSHGTERDLSAVVERLDVIAAALQPHAARVPEQSGEPGAVGRTPVGEAGSLAVIASHLAEIKDLVRLQSFSQPARGTVELMEEGPRHPDARWPALGELRQRLTAERNATRRGLYFLTPATILQRYGRPTSISVSGNGRITWSYNNGQPGESAIVLHIRFMDGYVIDAS